MLRTPKNVSSFTFYLIILILLLLQATPSREIVSWIAVEHEQKEALDIFAREVAPAGTGMGKAARKL